MKEMLEHFSSRKGSERCYVNEISQLQNDSSSVIMIRRLVKFYRDRAGGRGERLQWICIENRKSNVMYFIKEKKARHVWTYFTNCRVLSFPRSLGSMSRDLFSEPRLGTYMTWSFTRFLLKSICTLYTTSLSLNKIQHLNNSSLMLQTVTINQSEFAYILQLTSHFWIFDLFCFSQDLM